MVLTMGKLWGILILVWATTLLTGAGVAWYAASASAHQTNTEDARSTCLSRKAARDISIANAQGNREYFVAAKKEAKHEIHVALGVYANREASAADLADAKALLQHNQALLNHIPVIEVPAPITC